MNKRFYTKEHSSTKSILFIGMSPNYGGTEAVIMGFARYVVKHKIPLEMHFLNVYDEPIACEEEIRAFGGTIAPLKLQRRKGLIRYYKGIKNFYRAEGHSFDSVVLNEQDPVNLDMLKYAKRFGVPHRIVHAHNSGYGSPQSLLSRIAIWVNKRLLMRRATTLVACSSKAAEFNFGRHTKLASIVPNGIEVARFRFSQKNRDHIRSLLGVRDKIVLLNVGRLDPQKNQSFLLRAFKQALKKNTNLYLIIEGKGYLRDTLMHEIAELGLEKSVSLIEGTIPPNEMYSAADAFVLPSLFEGYPVTLIEAQVSGLPCFVSDVVTREASVTDDCYFVELDEVVWSNMFLLAESKRGSNRMETCFDLKADGETTNEMLSKLYV